jgi:uncharacterized protein
MTRIILLIILIWLLYQVVKRIAASANPKHKQSGIEEKFVQCAHCGCHIPESESQIRNDKFYCCNPECQNLDSQKNEHGD